MTRAFAYIAGSLGVLLSAAAAAVVVITGANASFLTIYLVACLMSLLGAMVALRTPRNSVGWLMCGFAVLMSLVHLPAGYAYLEPASPLAMPAAWLSAWDWVLVAGLTLPLISVRFPDGDNAAPAVDVLAVAGRRCSRLESLSGVAISPLRSSRFQSGWRRHCSPMRAHPARSRAICSAASGYAVKRCWPSLTACPQHR
jgi:hypothetical protein